MPTPPLIERSWREGDRRFRELNRGPNPNRSRSRRTKIPPKAEFSRASRTPKWESRSSTSLRKLGAPRQEACPSKGPPRATLAPAGRDSARPGEQRRSSHHRVRKKESQSRSTTGVKTLGGSDRLCQKTLESHRCLDLAKRRTERLNPSQDEPRAGQPRTPHATARTEPLSEELPGAVPCLPSLTRLVISQP